MHDPFRNFFVVALAMREQPFICNSLYCALCCARAWSTLSRAMPRLQPIAVPTAGLAVHKEVDEVEDVLLFDDPDELAVACHQYIAGRA